MKEIIISNTPTMAATTSVVLGSSSVSVQSSFIQDSQCFSNREVKQ